MKLYIAGPMSGYPDHNFPAFNAMAKELRGLGFEVVNPAELAEDDSQPWEYYMRRDIPLLCQCDGIVLLPGWQHSDGAQLEHHIAVKLKMEIVQWNGVAFTKRTPVPSKLLTLIQDAIVSANWALWSNQEKESEEARRSLFVRRI